MQATELEVLTMRVMRMWRERVEGYFWESGVDPAFAMRPVTKTQMRQLASIIRRLEQAGKEPVPYLMEVVENWPLLQQTIAKEKPVKDSEVMDTIPSIAFLYRNVSLLLETE